MSNVEILYVDYIPSPSPGECLSVIIRPCPEAPTQMMVDLGGDYYSGNIKTFITNESQEQRFSFESVEDAISHGRALAEHLSVGRLFVVDRWTDK